ncbi:alpha/beta hydrolase [Rossellomorea sp. NS-SX7]|uniref:alpha/beta hydrolase n=1 Tax=Rossellomorea sp. NS-SX7 TaxID=3463856 RepID=UPI0040593161
MKVTSSSIRGFKNNEVPYRLLISSEHPKGLAIFFPGMGYTVMGPLLHYPTGMLLNEGWDVLHINYQYDSDEYKNLSDEEFDEMLLSDCKNVIDAVLGEKSYESFILIAKSIGTIPMSNELQRETFKEAKVIWLTPLLKEDIVYNSMKESQHKGICFIGDRDHHYVEERFTGLNSNHHLHLHLIPGANHSLEQDFQVLRSMDTHKDIMAAIETFIKET